MDEYRTSRGALGNTQAGDGWRFRGGGIKQLTGRSNYSVFAKDTGITTEEAGDYVRTKKGALESACWFWKKNNIARYADADDIDGMSKAINGGRIGIEDRRSRYAQAKSILNSTYEPGQETMSVGSRGDLVQKVQVALKIGADGIFGRGTEAAVKSWQRINRHTTTGMLTQDQIKQLLRG
jgi:peptidoglycan hydrolase-like protein with peptidoglycan-binding domain